MATILIVDDDDMMRDMLLQMMETDGHSAMGAADGKKAIGLLENNVFELVVTDLIMPEKEGLETIRYLKKNHPHIPIIAISGGTKMDPESYLGIAKMLGAKYTFTKPIDRAAFLAAIKECVKNNNDPSQ
ncbi:MAG: response regulator [Deltaproteobacteria bacterium]|nr:response regulator [Deltaproteobacteria bacterium]